MLFQKKLRIHYTYRKKHVKRWENFQLFSIALSSLHKGKLWYIIKEMTAQEKNQLYSILRTLSAWPQGYTAPGFDGAAPYFTDDIQKEAVKENPSSFDPGAPAHHEIPLWQELPLRQEAIGQLEEKIRQCKRCKLCKGRKQACLFFAVGLYCFQGLFYIRNTLGILTAF